ncbi:MAG: hypothetical protein H0W86_03265 [Armatimonadetes bacterium]|nr:hypothetical protein [Armatimonadota bacterium]
MRSLYLFGVLMFLLVGACGTRPDNLSNRMPESSDSSPKGKAARPQPDKLVVWAEWSGDRLILTRKPFDPDGKSIEYAPKEHPHNTKIDGLRAWGSEESLPHDSELTRFELEIDNQRYTLPRELWANCYDPNFFVEEEDAWGRRVVMPRVHAMATPNKKLLIQFYGSDGGGGYSAFYEIDVSKMACTRTITEEDNKISEVLSGRLIRIAK